MTSHTGGGSDRDRPPPFAARRQEKKHKKVTSHRQMQGHFFLWRKLALIVHRTNHIALGQTGDAYCSSLMAAWAAASRAMGTRKGEQET